MDFLGIDVTPIFVQRLLNSSDGVMVEITETSTDVGRATPQTVVVQSLLQKSSFQGRSDIAVRPIPDSQQSQLSVQLTLTLQIPLPPLLPLPPGFNAAGSALMRSTGRKRVRQLLQDLQGGYENRLEK